MTAGVPDVRQGVVLREHGHTRCPVGAELRGECGLQAEGTGLHLEPGPVQQLHEQGLRLALLEGELRVRVNRARDTQECLPDAIHLLADLLLELVDVHRNLRPASVTARRGIGRGYDGDDYDDRPPRPTPDLDLRSAQNLQDPYPVHRWLRDHDPVHWSESLQGWIVTRYADVREVFNQPARFSSDRFRKLGPRFKSDRPEVRAVADVLADWLVFRDAPDHTRLRNLLQKTFTPRHLEKNRDGIQITVDSLLDHVAARGEMDFIRDFAFPLPALVIAILLGAPKSDIEDIKDWSDRLASYVGGAVDDRDNFARGEVGGGRALGLLPRASRRSGATISGDDLMSLLLQAEHEGDQLSEEEVVSNCVLLLFAGHETTTNLLGNGLFHLLSHPEALQALRDRPAARGERHRGVPSLRGSGRSHHQGGAGRLRVARRTSSGRGDRVLPFMAAADRDPRQFERPDALDITRQPNRHLAFGFGIHFCLGAPLARLEASLAFTSLLRRFPDLDPRRSLSRAGSGGSSCAAWKSLPVRWSTCETRRRRAVSTPNPRPSRSA